MRKTNKEQEKSNQAEGKGFRPCGFIFGNKDSAQNSLDKTAARKAKCKTSGSLI